MNEWMAWVDEIEDWSDERVTKWEAQCAALTPPATMNDLLAMARTGQWASPQHRAAYDEWIPHAGRRLVAAIRCHLGHDLSEDL